MAPGILAPEPSFTLNEMDKTAREKHDFGAVIEDLDLNNISGMYNSNTINPFPILTVSHRCRCKGTSRFNLDT